MFLHKSVMREQETYGRINILYRFLCYLIFQELQNLHGEGLPFSFKSFTSVILRV